MKIAPLLAVFSLVSVLAACDSLDNPFHTIMNTGHDARVYNGSTGNWEWPSPTPTSKPKPTPKIVKAPATPPATPVKKVAAPTPVPQKAGFVQGKSPDATPVPAIPTPTPGPVATPPPPWATKATGYYNPTTGKIEWGAPAPPLPKFIPIKTPKPTRAPKATPTPKASPAKAGKVTPAPKATPAS